MMTLTEVTRIHALLIAEFGGTDGVRDITLLESALARPYQTFDGNELYPDAVSKAAAIFESVIINHPFMDGNKRIAYVLMRLVLMDGNTDISASEDAKYDFVIAAASGRLRFEEMRKWIGDHCV
jgi:death-on-curing protein